MSFLPARRLQQLPPYVFVAVDKLKREAIARGADIIDFGVGDPDLGTPRLITQALARAARDPATHRYPDGEGSLALREAVAAYYGRRFGVRLDPRTEVTTLIGSKEGIAHVAGAVVNPGETVAFPDPGYPVYHAGTLFAGGRSRRLYLTEANRGLPDLEAWPTSALSRLRLLWVNYPHSPTGTVAPLDYLEKLVWLARKHDFYICSDAAYVDVYFDGVKPPSVLQVRGARGRVLEFYSCSKSFNMTGWRLGFAVGHAGMVAALRAFKNNVDSGQFAAIQRAAVVGFENAEKIVAANNRLYQRRRDTLIRGLRRLDWEAEPPPATFYVWLKTRHGLRSMAMVKALLERCAIVATPGFGLGRRSDDHVRLALTTGEDRIRAALGRLAAAGL